MPQAVETHTTPTPSDRRLRRLEHHVELLHRIGDHAEFGRQEAADRLADRLESRLEAIPCTTLLGACVKLRILRRLVTVSMEMADVPFALSLVDEVLAVTGGAH